MRKSRSGQNFGLFAGISLLIIIFISCERNDYELLDPATAGTWTLFDTSDGLPGNNVADIRLDKNGNLWMSFPGQGVAKYNDGIWTYYKTATSAILSNVVSCVAEASDGSIVFGTSSGVSILSGTTTWSSYIDPLLTTMTVTAVKAASNGTLWIGTAGQGFYTNNGTGFIKTNVDTYKSINVRAIEEDATGNIWIGTDNGLIKWNGTAFSTYNVANGLPSRKVSTILRDSRKKLWIGTRGGKTVSWIDVKGIHQLSLMNSRDSCTINDIFEDRSGNVWFATASDGLVKYDGIVPVTYNSDFTAGTGFKFPENTITAIGEDKYGNVWFGLASKGIVKYTLPIN